MDRADVRDHADVRLGDLGQLGDLPGAAHPHLQDQRLGPGGRGQDRQRQPDLGVEVLAGSRGPRRGSSARADVLDRGLPRRARDADDRAAELAPPVRARAPAARAAGRRRRRPSRRTRARRARASRRSRGPTASRRRTPQAPALSAAERELAAVGVARRAGRRRGRPGRRSARVDHRALGRRRRRRGRASSAPAAAAIRSPSRAITWPPAASRRSSSRATSRSSNGIFRPPSNSWPCSWPLPAITTMSPAAASPSASAIAARRSASTDDARRSSIPARICSMIASGSSERGLSEVTTARSESSAAGAPHQGPLVAVAVAAAAEDRDQPSLGEPPGGAQHVLERVGRVRVVDEHARSAGPRRSARSGPGPARRRPAPRPPASRSSPRAWATARAARAFSTLKWPGSGRPDVEARPPALRQRKRAAGGVEARRRGAEGRRRRPPRRR